MSLRTRTLSIKEDTDVSVKKVNKNPCYSEPE